MEKKSYVPFISLLSSTLSNLKQVEHLKVLAEIGRMHGKRPALLSDLKATYKWLDEHTACISADLMNENVFLNVDDPESDEPWVWHSASTLVKDLQDVGELHEVKAFLRKYDDLLKAASVETIKRVTARPVAVVDKTLVYQRLFCEFRKRGFEVSVTFKAKDDEYEILPAHKAWLIMNSEHFMRMFLTAGLEEAYAEGSGKVEVDVPDYSSLCVKEVIGEYRVHDLSCAFETVMGVDWIYVGELPESITSPGCVDEEKRAKLDLALEMLSLSHYWEVTELHGRLQEFIVNAPDDFINPYWAQDSK